MEFSREEKIKIKIDNNNCIISGIKTSKTNSNISSNVKTKSSSLKKFQKIHNNLYNEISLSISNSIEKENNNNDLSMLEITEKSIFSSEIKNGSINNNKESEKKKEKKLKKIKDLVGRKLNFDLVKNNKKNINDFSQIKNKKINKSHLLNKIILDYSHKPMEKKIHYNPIKRRITKTIKMNLNFKEINLRKNYSFRENKNPFEEKKFSIHNSKGNSTNNFDSNVSFNNIFEHSKEEKNNNTNKDSRKKIINKENSEKNKGGKKNLKKQLSLSINNNNKKTKHDYDNSVKNIKNLMINTLKRNNFNNIFEISSKKYNTYLTTANNSSNLKSNNYNFTSKQFSYKINKVNTKYIKSSNNSTNNSYRNTLCNYKSDSKNNNKLYNKMNYFFNSEKTSIARFNFGKKNSKTKILKIVLKIFGKKLYNPIKSKQDDKFIKNIKLLNIISNNNNGNILGINSLQKNKEKKSSFSYTK